MSASIGKEWWEMMDKRPMTPFAKMCYAMFMQGLTAYQIQKRTHRDMDSITNARAEIFNKGYELPELATPRSELPDNIEMTREVMKAMSEKEKRRILTDEERQQIIEEVGAGMSQKECAKKHDLHPTTVCHVIKQYRQSLAEQENSEPVQTVSEPEEATEPNSGLSETTTPKIIVNAVKAKLEEVEKCIHLSEQILANANADRDTLLAWLEVHNAE